MGAVKSGVVGGLPSPNFVNQTAVKETNLHGVFVSETVISGDGSSITLAPATLAATGALLIQGTATKILADATLSATGALAITGSLSGILADATLSATSVEAISGSATVTLDDATLSAAGTLAITGAAAITLVDTTLSATGAEAIAGTLGDTLADATLAATGALAITGVLDAALDDATLGATGTLGLTGTLDATLDDASVAGAGALAIAGTLDETLADATLVATGTLAGDDTGTLGATLAAATLSATGALAITGAADVTLDDATLSTGSPDTLALLIERAKGLGGSLPRRRKRPITGEIALYLPPLWLAAEGDVGEPPEGEFAARLTLPFDLRGHGAVGAAGRVACKFAMPELVLAGDGELARYGDGRASIDLAPWLRSRGRYDQFSDADAEEMALLLLETL